MGKGSFMVAETKVDKEMVQRLPYRKMIRVNQVHLDFMKAEEKRLKLKKGSYLRYLLEKEMRQPCQAGASGGLAGGQVNNNSQLSLF